MSGRKDEHAHVRGGTKPRPWPQEARRHPSPTVEAHLANGSDPILRRRRRAHAVAGGGVRAVLQR